MKKIISLLLVIVAVLSLSVVAFAGEILSPVAPVEIVITARKVIATIDGKVQTNPIKIEKGTQIVFKYDPSVGTFDRIAYYVVDKDGKAMTDKDGKFIEAKENEDYKVISTGDKEYTLELNTDLIICGDYDGKITNPNTGEPIEEDSPKTGDNGMATEMIICAVLLAGAAFVFGAKKQLSK